MRRSTCDIKVELHGLLKRARKTTKESCTSTAGSSPTQLALLLACLPICSALTNYTLRVCESVLDIDTPSPLPQHRSRPLSTYTCCRTSILLLQPIDYRIHTELVDSRLPISQLDIRLSLPIICDNHTL